VIEADLWLGIRFLHVLAMAFFVGGQIVVAVAVVPAERDSPDRERLRLIARRFGVGSLIALGVLVITGIAMASHLSLWSDETLQLKLALVVLTVVLVLSHLRYPQLHLLQAAVLTASLLIVWLGLSLAH
jgi:uncharacterized membrane protein